MSNMSKKTLEAKVKELEMFLKIATKENEELKEKIKELEKQGKNKPTGRKPYDNKEVIKQMFNLYLEGLSLQEIANEFNSTNILTARGKTWSKSSISWIMRKEENKDLVGKDMYNKVIRRMKNNKPSNIK